MYGTVSLPACAFRLALLQQTKAPSAEIQQLLTAFHVDLCQQQQQQELQQLRSGEGGGLEQSAHTDRGDGQEEQSGTKMRVQKRGKKRKSHDAEHGDSKTKVAVATMSTKIDTTISASTQ